MRPAAEIMLVEGEALRPVIEAASRRDLDLPTICDGWSVRDVLAHCGAALTLAAADHVHGFTPADNEADVELRRRWSIGDVIEELFEGYPAAARAIDRAGGVLDGIGIGEWVHGGDVRAALGAEKAYASAGIDLAVGLLLERSAARGAPPLDVTIDGSIHRFGGPGTPTGTLTCDAATFVRLCGGRRPDPGRFHLTGAVPPDLVLFT